MKIGHLSLKLVIILLSISYLVIGCTPNNTPATNQPNATPTPSEFTVVSTIPPLPTKSPKSKFTNLALNKPVTASAVQSGNPAEMAVDGITKGNNFWSAGDEPEQWIEIDLEASSDVYNIQLIAFQFPPGEATHRVLGRADLSGDFRELHLVEEYIEDGQVINIDPDNPWEGLRYIRIETLSTPDTAFVEWREILVNGVPAGTMVDAPSPSDLLNGGIVFYNGTVITMEEEYPVVTAIAILGNKIKAVGSDEEILAMTGEETYRYDLNGRTLMPGFVDSHTHILKDVDGGIEGGQQEALANGITTLAELGAHPEFLEEVKAFNSRGLLKVRTSMYLLYTNNCGDIVGDWYQEHPTTSGFGEKVRIKGIKVFADGGTCGFPALSFEYKNVGGYGDLFHSQEDLNIMVAEAHNLGYQVAIHAQGDVAIEQAQNAIEFALGGDPNALRHHIEHNALHRPDLLPRYGEIGIVPTFFGHYSTCAEVNDNVYTMLFGLENLEWLENTRMFLDANPDLIVAWHGDDPWIGPVSPIVELHSLVTRQEVADDGSVCMPPDWLASHAITVQEGLEMMTVNAAYSLFREDEVGSLKPGKLADLIILSDSPVHIDPNDLYQIEVRLTMVDGVVEYCAPGEVELCP